VNHKDINGLAIMPVPRLLSKKKVPGFMTDKNS